MIISTNSEPHAVPFGGSDCSAGWMPIETAPKDGSEIVVYCPDIHGLGHMASLCAWHADAGFCVDELREPKFWMTLPNDPVEARRE